MVEELEEKKKIGKTFPVLVSQCPRVWEDFGSFFVAVMVEFIVQFVIYRVICHGYVGCVVSISLKQLLLVQDDW